MKHMTTLVFLLAVAMPTLATTPNELLAEYTAKAGTAAVPERGEKMFTTNFGKALGFSCSSCHGAVPVKAGQDLVAEKAIAPLAPAANAKRFTDRARVEFMFKMNCKDVIGRECTAGEKADLISWLLTLKP
jgi:mono/diheme cytochrome c family protein